MSNISPRVDLAFKKIFGVEENKDLLISLVNSIVSKEDQISDVTLLNPYNPQNFKSDKLSILDIKAVNQDGKKFNIEIQINDEDDYDKRALYYWAKIYTEQLKSGDDYSELSKAIGIHILNFTSITETDRYHNAFHITEKNTGLVYFHDLELHTIELKKFSDKNEGLNDLVSRINNALDMWVTFLTKNDLLIADKLPKELNDPNLKKAINVLNIMQFTDEEREAYDNHLKWLRMEAGAIKKQVDKAKEEGRIEGKIEGMIEGKMESKIEIAINLLKQNIDVKIISLGTGLSEEEILSLQKNIN